ncbi:MAG: MBL fold metallo-hydrolase [Gammaproteobacteria bacterium]|nr:MBL fold metallo-hydrolase [Gammaproteobacteria bacterium]
MKIRPIILALTCLFSTSATFAAAPLPESAKGVPIPKDKGYFVEEIKDGLYWVTEGAYTAMFLTTGKGVIVVDAPPSFGDKMLKAIADVTKEPITHVVYSHAHADHIGGASLYPKTAHYIAHIETKKRLQRMSDPSRAFPYGMFVGGKTVPLPSITFKESYTLKVGNQELTLEYKGDDHEPGNIYIYAQKQKVLMKTDIIFPGWTPFKGLAIAEDTMGYLKAHDVILSYDFDKLVSGHWGRLATRNDVEIQKQYMQDIQANAGKALQTVDFYAIAGKVGYANTSLLFETYLNAVSQECANLTEPKWIDKLGGVDIWTKDHCYKVIMAIRVD